MLQRVLDWLWPDEAPPPKGLPCEVCMEPGEARDCCGKYYCGWCYVKEGYCPSCHIGTRVEKGTGEFVTIKDPKEREECRRCLEQGIRRTCCGNYYCDACFYKHTKCPSCGREVAPKGITHDGKPEPIACSMILTYCMSAMFILSAVAVLLITITNEVLAPRTVYEYDCHGIYKTCGNPVCLDAGTDEVLNGLQPLDRLPYCHLNSSLRVRGDICVFDSELYRQTEKAMGFDLCSSTFNKGIYVLEDDFDNWAVSNNPQSARMVTARWGSSQNVNTSNFCGSTSGNKALVFSGIDIRELETKPLNVQYGGEVQFQLKLAPADVDESKVSCKPSFQSSFLLQYKTPQTEGNWTSDVQWQWDAVDYRSQSFLYQAVKLPPEASTNATRFRFLLTNFLNAQDFLALDDVRILHYLPDGWEDDDTFQKHVDETHDGEQLGACCFDTERCETRLTAQEWKECKNVIPKYTPESPLWLRGVELYVFVAGGIALFRWIYRMGQQYFVSNKIPFRDFTKRIVAIPFVAKLMAKNKYTQAFVRTLNTNTALGTTKIHPEHVPSAWKELMAADDDQAKRANKLLKRKFKLRVSRTWRLLFLLTVPFPAAIFLIAKLALMREYVLFQDILFFGAVRNRFKTTAVIVLLIAMILDIKDIVRVSKDVICLSKTLVPAIEVDARNEVNALFVGSFKVSLQDVKEIHPFPRSFINIIAGCYIAGTLPWAIFALLLKDTYPPYESMRVFSVMMGVFICLKALMGPDLIVKGLIGVRWMFDFTLDGRMALASAIEERKVKLMVLNFGFVVTFLIAISIAIVADYVFLVGVALAFLVSCFYAFLMGTANSLPITPWMLLTTLDSGVWFRVVKRMQCPCVHYGSYCTDMHEQEVMLILFCENALRFQEMIAHTGVGMEDD